jgi:histone arginine demethylase JMJD6
MNIAQLLQNPFVERSQGLDKETFNERFGFPAQPVVITDMTNAWEAKQKWNFEFFKNRFGTITGNAERTQNGQKESAVFTIADYVDYMTTTDDESPFYLRNTQFHLGTELKDDYQVPEYFDCWYANSTQGKARYALSWIFMGAANTFSKLHLDIWDSSAWNAVLSGKKLWVFYDESQAEYLYDGQVNPFEPDFEKFPNFVHARPLVCVQGAGDVVFTPSGWWHAVMNVEAGISITENFINETNYEAVIESFAKQGKPQACRDIQALADKYGELVISY